MSADSHSKATYYARVSIHPFFWLAVVSEQVILIEFILLIFWFNKSNSTAGAEQVEANLQEQLKKIFVL